MTNWLKCGIMRGRAVQDSFTCPSPAFRTHPHMRFFRSQKWTFIFTSSLPKQKQLFFRNMGGPPRAGHIWTNPGAWFFHLQFYKKYVIIFKKGKICRENFPHEHFIEKRLFITREWKWDLFSKYFFECGGQKNFLSRWVGIKISPP